MLNIDDELVDGESIVWTGKPARWVSLINWGLYLGFIVPSLFAVIFIPYLMSYGLSYVLFPIAIFLIVTITPLLYYYRKATFLVYALTDKRVLIINQRSRSVQALHLRHIRKIEKQYQSTETGNIILDIVHMPVADEIIVEKFSFLSINNVDSVYRKLDNLLQ